MTNQNGKTETSPLMADVDQGGHFRGQSVDRMEMEKTTHNDPVAKNAESMSQLRGSTLMLKNIVVSHSQANLTGSLRRIIEAHKQGQEQQRNSAFAKAYQANRHKAVLFLDKVKTNFFEDARSLAEGTIPQSVVLATIIGIVCGIACWLYYKVLFFFLEYIWTTIPENYIEGNWLEEKHWLYIPLATSILCSLVGLTVVFMGEPGDLPYTIS
eukprot:CAMPEP_0176006722 /NCGR_PEP_ID=MMETSP0120_2-20121206/2868_1 /TAXON_ID=160619 /ORGANISM="Kryptoperidinium foliaceum, Strain CCMP 1326" /LENGTH=211 /DNA_ID=CAMNT_0017339469 /DNA_START=25 /DNA_END=657 /DNA_ORIENTATION=+